MKVLIDAGHGENTPGKRSPDGKFREYAYAREIAKVLVERLSAAGYDAELVTPENYDVPLSTRVRRVNTVCRAQGNSNVLVVSIHNNAAGSKGQWLNARGWQVCIGLNASAKSKQLATFLTKAAESQGLSIRRPKPYQNFWEQNLAICRDTLCPAVLTENLFQDNKEDVAFLLSEKGKEAIVELHFKGIVNYIKNVSG